MRRKAAKTVSILLNPPIVLVLGGALFIHISPISMSTGLKWVAISAAVTALPLYLAIKVLEKYGHINFSDPQDRPPFYLTALALGVVLLAIMEIHSAPALLATAVYAGLATTAIAIAINRYMKTSLHTGSLSAMAAAAAFFSPPAASALFLLTAVMAWSRMELGEHDLKETVAGAAIPIATVTAVFLLTGAGSQ